MMNIRVTLRGLTVLLIVGLLGACSNDTVSEPSVDAALTASAIDLQFAGTSSVQRPFSDYLETQGTFCFPDGEGGCFDFEPPVQNFLGWTDPNSNFNALFEYLGNADTILQEQSGGTISLGTRIHGSIVERPLADGRALVKINVQAKNILAWVTDIQSYYLDPIVFGTRVEDVLNGAEPSLGHFNMEVQFVSPAPGLPIPDLFQLFLVPEEGQELVHVAVNMSATGTFHDGSGLTPGTRGRVKVTQVFPPLPGSDYDTGWAVERIRFIPFGGRGDRRADALDD